MKKINEIKAGDTYQGIVKIVRKAKPGPVILEITDGTGFIDAVTKECQFNSEDIVEISGPVSERAGKLQLEIKSIKASTQDFSGIIKQKSIPSCLASFSGSCDGIILNRCRVCLSAGVNGVATAGHDLCHEHAAAAACPRHSPQRQSTDRKPAKLCGCFQRSGWW